MFMMGVHECVWFVSSVHTRAHPAAAGLCAACARTTQALISVQLLVFFPVEQQSEAFSAKALVNNSGPILFAAGSRNKTGH